MLSALVPCYDDPVGSATDLQSAARQYQTLGSSPEVDILKRALARDQVPSHTDSGAQEEQDAGDRLDEEAGQPAFDGPGIARRIDQPADQPHGADCGRADVAQREGADPERGEEDGQPFMRVLVNPEDALEIGVA